MSNEPSKPANPQPVQNPGQQGGGQTARPERFQPDTNRQVQRNDPKPSERRTK